MTSLHLRTQADRPSIPTSSFVPFVIEERCGSLRGSIPERSSDDFIPIAAFV